jgi:hypothetical protein
MMPLKEISSYVRCNFSEIMLDNGRKSHVRKMKEKERNLWSSKTSDGPSRIHREGNIMGRKP